MQLLATQIFSGFVVNFRVCLLKQKVEHFSFFFLSFCELNDHLLRKQEKKNDRLMKKIFAAPVI